MHAARDVSTWVGKFDKVNDFAAYRRTPRPCQAGRRPGRGLLVHRRNSNGQQDGDEPEQGKIFGYIEEQDSSADYGVLYVDDLDCRCYLQMY